MVYMSVALTTLTVSGRLRHMVHMSPALTTLTISGRLGHMLCMSLALKTPPILCRLGHMVYMSLALITLTISGRLGHICLFFTVIFLGLLVHLLTVTKTTAFLLLPAVADFLSPYTTLRGFGLVVVNLFKGIGRHLWKYSKEKISEDIIENIKK